MRVTFVGGDLDKTAVDLPGPLPSIFVHVLESSLPPVPSITQPRIYRLLREVYRLYVDELTGGYFYQYEGVES